MDMVAPVPPDPDDERRRTGLFQEALETLINRHSRENASNTPDFILAEYLTACLAAWNAGTQARDSWYGARRPPGAAAR